MTNEEVCLTGKTLTTEGNIASTSSIQVQSSMNIHCTMMENDPTLHDTEHPPLWNLRRPTTLSS